MSRSFAMWIESAAWTKVRGRSLVVHGAALGRAPEPGTALLVQPASGPPLRAHAAGLVMSARGASQPGAGIGLAGLPEIDAQSLHDAIVHEEGVLVRVFRARLKDERPPLHDAVRIEMAGDTAWGLVSIGPNSVTVAVVGGGLPLGASLWSRLTRLVPQQAEPLERDALALISAQEGWWREHADLLPSTPPRSKQNGAVKPSREAVPA
jgi:hypothetical protein